MNAARRRYFRMFVGGLICLTALPRTAPAQAIAADEQTIQVEVKLVQVDVQVPHKKTADFRAGSRKTRGTAGGTNEKGVYR